MKKSRIIVLFLALAAAAGAFVLGERFSTRPSRDRCSACASASAHGTTFSLPRRSYRSGPRSPMATSCGSPWPKDAATPGMLRKSENPKVIDELKGSFVKVALAQGEPVHREKLVKGANGGFMSVILSSGKRAVAINIDSQGATSAGGFILPNDRVDVIRTYHQEAKGAVGGSSGDSFVSETLLANVKVLGHRAERSGQEWSAGRSGFERHSGTGSGPSRNRHPGSADRAIIAGLTLHARAPMTKEEAARQALTTVFLWFATVP